jgi:hypothetical protein
MTIMLRTPRLLAMRVSVLVLAALATATASAQAQTTALFFDSEPGDYIGQGIDRTYTPADGTFTISTDSSNPGNWVRLTVADPNFSFWWYAEFSAANGAPLAAGSYGSVQEYRTARNHGLSVTGSGRGCGIVRGRFVIREIVLGPGGTVSAFAADFEQHCDDRAPGLFGAVRYNSSVSDLLPFAGNYPIYQLTIAEDARGRVTGTGIDCGAGHSICQSTLSSAAVVTLTATPEPDSVFIGWSGDCAGTATTTVHVNTIKTCTPLFEPLASSSPRTMLYWQSEAGDYIGHGQERLYAPQNSEWQVQSGDNGRRINFSIRDELSSWSVNFSAPQGQQLAVGSYGAAHRYPFTPLNGLSVSGDGRGCNTLTGRFVVLEIAIASNGVVQRFAADFEQHCEDAAPALVGSIRYNATVDEVLPFGGTPHLYQLTVVPPAHGRVAGGGLDCGSSGPVCQLTLPAAARLSLTAVPDFGYVFMGWAGNCQGGATTSLHVTGPEACEVLFEPLISALPRTVLYWDSQPGDSIGAGGKAVYSPANSYWRVQSSTDRSQIQLWVEDGTDNWSLSLSRAAGTPLTPGYYSAARRAAFASGNGLDVWGSGRGCNTQTGRFVVLEIVFGSNGTVQRFAADFEQHCEDGVPALFGAIRYNSTIDEVMPFGGVYPSYQLFLSQPTHGQVTGTSISCGSAGSQCQLTLAAAAQLTLTATPDFGYTFTGWTEDCSGGTTTTLHLNGPKQCAATFEPTVAVAPRTLLRWDSEPGHYIGQGRSEVLSLMNSSWRAASFQNGNMAEFTVRSVGPVSDSYWTLRFQAPTGEVLQTRQYLAADDFAAPGVPALVIFGNGRFCGGGQFTVRELVLGTQDTVLRFAADFVFDCGSSSGPRLTGSLQYQSLVDVATTTLSIDPASLRFASLHNGSSVTVQPPPQAVRLTLSRPNVGWTASANQPWILVSPASGTGSAVMTIGLNLLGGHPGNGTATGRVTVTLTDGTGTSRPVDLTVTLHPVGTTTPAFGVIDTPLPWSGVVTGALPMTGWALDDLGVTSLTICRAAVGGEVSVPNDNCGGAAQIFLGNGTFIEGARPDVQTAYPTMPRSDRSGWGFMLLTNMLPNQGNGTFVLYAYARDLEGRTVLLGSRVIAVDNAHATAPFGAIDTPAQGETIGGSAHVNFGWALTQNPKHIPLDGSTLTVYVDGVAIGSPSYNHYRSDVALLFPNLANSTGPVGFRVLDTTTLSNGLHTIVWTATDSAGVTSGLGSRFFRVANGVTTGAAIAAVEASPAIVSGAIAAGVSLDDSPILARRGWDAEAPWRRYGTGGSGRIVLRGEELDRFELALGGHADETYAGYLRVGDALRPLPIGSRLEARTGAFTWSPGVGFVGTYDLVFVRSAGGRQVARREIRVILHAKGSGHIGARVIVDTPRWQQDVAQPFMLAGWAADLNAAAGTGIDTIHVWAYPLSGGAPVFLGTAAHGGARPDVAAIHGDQFRDAGYGLMVQGLTPGNYDLAVFAWSNVSGDFVPAQVVRITAR